MIDVTSLWEFLQNEFTINNGNLIGVFTMGIAIGLFLSIIIGRSIGGNRYD
jgi:hypothetical protein